MNIMSDIADSLPTVTQRTKARIATLLLVMFLLTPALVGTAAANDHDLSRDFLCEDTSTSDSDGTEGFTNTLSALMLVFLVGGPVIGMSMAAYYTFALAAKPGEDSYVENRKKAFMAGWMVPFFIYGGGIFSKAVLGINLSCIMP